MTVVNDGLPRVLKLLSRAVRLEKVDDANKYQETVPVMTLGRDGPALLLVSVGRDALHGRAVVDKSPPGCSLPRTRPCRLPSTPGLAALGDVVDGQEETVVHYLQTLQHSAVSLDGVEQLVMQLTLQVKTVRVHLQEVEIFEGRAHLLPFFLARLSIQSGAFQIEFVMNLHLTGK